MLCCAAMAVYFIIEGSASEAEQSLLWDYGCQGIEELAAGGIQAYFDAPIALPESLEGRWQEIEEVDWMAKYYAELQPIYLNKLIVSPSHHQIEAQQGEKVIYLDPGMAFGTGHHETTYLALQALEATPLQDAIVLDVGTGSGLLAIAASVLGATQVDALDNDPLTIPIAKKNIVNNAAKYANATNHAMHAIDVRCDTLNDATPAAHYDVVVANLFAELHVALMQDYARAIKADGRLIITGILEERLPLVLRALEPYFVLEQQEQRNEWILLTATKQPIRKLAHG